MQFKNIKPGMFVAWKDKHFAHPRKVKVAICNAELNLVKVSLPGLPPDRLCSVPPRQLLGEWDVYQAAQEAKRLESEARIEKWQEESAALDKRFDAIKQYFQDHLKVTPGRRVNHDDQITLTLDDAEKLVQFIRGTNG
jgi:hypothetical protein